MVTYRGYGVPARGRRVNLVDGKPAHLSFEDAADLAAIRPFL